MSSSADLSAALESALGANGAADLDTDGYAALSTALSAAAENKTLDGVDGHLGKLPARQGVQTARTYVEAALARLRGDLDLADQLYQPLCEKLNQQEAWPVLSRVAGEWLTASESMAAARYLVRAWKKSGGSAVSEETLRAAHTQLPDFHELTWCLGSMLEDRGTSKEGRRLLAASLTPLAEEKDIARVEETILRLVEAPEASVFLRCLEAVDALTKEGFGDPAAALFEMILPGALRHNLAEAAWKTARHALERHPGANAWRPLAVTVLKEARKNLPAIERMIEVSGLGRLALPAAEGLKMLDTVLPYSPGFYVEHSGWGLGEILDNDGESLTIKFATKPNHRMNLKAASQVLASLPADDLKVLVAFHKDRLRKLVTEDPVELVIIGLRRAGGEADGPALRKILVPAVLATGEWSGWWKKAKTAMASDPRIDARQAFRDSYALPDPAQNLDDDEDVAVELPIDEPQGIHHNMDLVLGYLEHHPGSSDALMKKYAERVEKWSSRTSAKLPERARAHLLLSKWQSDRKSEHRAAIIDFFTERFDLSTAGSQAEQIEMLDIGLASSARADALAVGLNARSATLRDRAFDSLFREGNPDPVAFYRRLSEAPSDNIDALFVAADRVAADADNDGRYDVILWSVLIGVLDLLNTTGREPVRKKGIKLMDARGGLMSRVRACPPDERTESILMARLRDWRASDRVLFPILDAFDDAGLSAVVQSVQSKRAQAHAKLFSAAPQDDIMSGAIIMTRFTFETLSAELARVNLDLKTVIPAAIRKARELGDLKENAEYEAAKLKQANASKRLTQLDAHLEKVRILEDLTVDGTKAGPATLVRIRDEETGVEAEYWILGEGDGVYGDNVISYRAPLGRSMYGRKAGEAFDYVTGETVKKFTLLSVAEKKPAGPPAGVVYSAGSPPSGSA